jgi:hypothetical protein
MSMILGKWGLIRVDPNSSRNASLPVLWYDPTLTITGAPGVVGRSVALHWPNRTTLTCANIYALDSHAQPIMAKTQSNDGALSYSSKTKTITILAVLALLTLWIY